MVVHDLGGDGPPLLACHATGFHGRVWAPVVAHLRGWHVWAPDLRGHGDTPAPADRDFAWDGFADDVLATVDELGLEQPMGVGHSKGGAALVLAEVRRPGTFRSLYLYEPVIFPPLADETPVAAEDHPLAAGALRRREVFGSVEDAIANYASKPPMSSFDPGALRAYVEGGFAPDPEGIRLKCRPGDESEVYRMGGAHDAWSHLGELTVPVTVARGAAIPWGPSAVVDAIVDRIPTGRVEPFEQLGHFGPLEQPAVIAASIVEHVDWAASSS